MRSQASLPGTGRPGGVARWPLALLGGACCLALLAGCAGDASQNGAVSAAELSPIARPADPIADFAGRASPGVQEMVVLTGGAAVSARVTREYAAASGRNCREVLVGGLNDGRAQVYCRDPSGQWLAARPLLRGSAVR